MTVILLVSLAVSQSSMAGKPPEATSLLEPNQSGGVRVSTTFRVEPVHCGSLVWQVLRFGTMENTGDSHAPEIHVTSPKEGSAICCWVASGTDYRDLLLAVIPRNSKSKDITLEATLDDTVTLAGTNPEKWILYVEKPGEKPEVLAKLASTGLVEAAVQEVRVHRPVGLTLVGYDGVVPCGPVDYICEPTPFSKSIKMTFRSTSPLEDWAYRITSFLMAFLTGMLPKTYATRITPSWLQVGGVLLLSAWLMLWLQWSLPTHVFALFLGFPVGLFVSPFVPERFIRTVKKAASGEPADPI